VKNTNKGRGTPTRAEVGEEHQLGQRIIPLIKTR